MNITVLCTFFVLEVYGGNCVPIYTYIVNCRHWFQFDNTSMDKLIAVILLHKPMSIMLNNVTIKRKYSKVMQTMFIATLVLNQHI